MKFMHLNLKKRLSRLEKGFGNKPENAGNSLEILQKYTPDTILAQEKLLAKYLHLTIFVLY